jgi:hypothetical protein
VTTTALARFAATALILGCSGGTQAEADPAASRVGESVLGEPNAAVGADLGTATNPISLEAVDAPAQRRPTEAPKRVALGWPADLSNVEIQLERTECYGWCPNYSVIIKGDGRVRYTGRSFVVTVGEREGTLPEATIRELVERFERARFFELRDKYSQSVTDLPSTWLTLRIGDRTKKVENYWVGADHEWGRDAEHRSIHIALDSIAEAIDRAVVVENWIGTEDQRQAIRDSFKTGWPGRR